MTSMAVLAGFVYEWSLLAGRRKHYWIIVVGYRLADSHLFLILLLAYDLITNLYIELLITVTSYRFTSMIWFRTFLPLVVFFILRDLDWASWFSIENIKMSVPVEF